MPDTSVAPQDGDPYDPRMEARVSRLEEHMGDVKSAIASPTIMSVPTTAWSEGLVIWIHSARWMTLLKFAFPDVG